MRAAGSLVAFSTIGEFLRSGFARLGAIARKGAWKREPRHLELRETLSLGSRGFLAVVRFGRQQFLVGGTSSSLNMLAQLPEVQETRESLAPAHSRKPRTED
jgi:flagellar biogenesis protein FliO